MALKKTPFYKDVLTGLVKQILLYTSYEIFQIVPLRGVHCVELQVSGAHFPEIENKSEPWAWIRS